MKCNKIIVDADACPNTIKEILFRAVARLKLPMIMVANQPIKFPPSKFIKSVVVGAGLDVADQHIVEITEVGDLIITADIPLAYLVVEKGGFALNPRGELYDGNNIKSILSMRNFITEMRNAGQVTTGPAPLNKQDNQKFAKALDVFLMKATK